MQITLSLLCPTDYVDTLKVVVRHSGPSSVFSVQPCQQYFLHQLVNPAVRASAGKAKAAGQGAAGCVSIDAVLTVNTTTDDVPGLLWVEVWNGSNNLYSRCILLLGQADAGWADDLHFYLTRLQCHYDEGTGAGMQPDPNNLFVSGAQAQQQQDSAPMQQLIQELGRWLAYAAAKGRNLRPALPTAAQLADLQAQSRSALVDATSVQALSENSMNSSLSTDASNSSLSLPAPAAAPWAGVQHASLHRFMVENALALFVEATEAGCVGMAYALLRSLEMAGMSLREAISATWHAAGGILDLPILHAAVMSGSPAMVRAFLCLLLHFTTVFVFLS